MHYHSIPPIISITTPGREWDLLLELMALSGKYVVAIGNDMLRMADGIDACVC